MAKHILVVYASVSGSTGEVAEAIGEVFTAHGAVVEVWPMSEAPDAASFDAVIVGSSIRAGRWLPEAQHYLEAHEQILEDKPVAFFTTCLTMVDDSEDSRRTVLAYMEPTLQTVPNVEPVGLGLFAGSLDPARQQFYAINPDLAPHGDYRNWDVIKGWAAEIAPILLSEAEKSAETVMARDATLAFTDMSNRDLQEADLHGADLYQSDLSQANLHKANLAETNLNEADLAKTDLRDATLNHAALNWAEMNWANMQNANLRGANLIGADLHAANLEQADLSYAILNGANLSDANLRGANLRHIDLNWANLNRIDLRQADLGYANLGWVNLSNAKLEQTNLENARYNEFTEWPEDFDPEEYGAILVYRGVV